MKSGGLLAEAEADWVTACITEALKTAPVPSGVSDAVKSKLEGTMGERALRAAELKELADALLAVPADTPSEAPDAD